MSRRKKKREEKVGKERRERVKIRSFEASFGDGKKSFNFKNIAQT